MGVRVKEARNYPFLPPSYKTLFQNLQQIWASFIMSETCVYRKYKNNCTYLYRYIRIINLRFDAFVGRIRNSMFGCWWVFFVIVVIDSAAVSHLIILYTLILWRKFWPKIFLKLEFESLFEFLKSLRRTWIIITFDFDDSVVYWKLYFVLISLWSRFIYSKLSG